MKVTEHEVRNTLEKSVDNFPALASLLSSLITQFGSDEGVKLADSVKEVSAALVRIARTTSECESAAKLVFNLLSKAIQDRTTGPDSRKVVVFFVANLLLKLYFRLHIIGPGQFDSISRNIISSGVRFSEYRRADQVGYRYYLGRYYLSQQQYRRARSHLLWAFNHCTNASPSNKRLILLYLTTASMPLGVFTSIELLEISNLSKPFLPLIVAMQKGDYTGFHAHLGTYEDWFYKYEIFLYLDQRCDMILYRSLFRRTFMLSTTTAQKTPNIRIAKLLCALQWATRDVSWNMSDCEALCVSLIDMGYIKGYIHHQNQILVLDKKDEKKFGFPNVSGIQIAQYENEDDRQFG